MLKKIFSKIFKKKDFIMSFAIVIFMMTIFTTNVNAAGTELFCNNDTDVLFDRFNLTCLNVKNIINNTKNNGIDISSAIYFKIQPTKSVSYFGIGLSDNNREWISAGFYYKKITDTSQNYLDSFGFTSENQVAPNSSTGISWSGNWYYINITDDYFNSIDDVEYPSHEISITFDKTQIRDTDKWVEIQFNALFKNWSDVHENMIVFVTSKTGINTSFTYSKYLINPKFTLSVTSKDIVYIRYGFSGTDGVEIVQEFEYDVHEILQSDEYSELYEKIKVYEDIYDPDITISKIIYNLTNFFNSISLHIKSVSKLISYAFNKCNYMLTMTIYTIVGSKILLAILKRLHF